jgi:uncharacterized membrane protein YfcA
VTEAAGSVLMILTVFVGAMSQRLTGMGFALIASPFLVVLMGPIGGVTTANLCSALASSLILGRVWREVQWPTFRRLAVWAILGIALGAWIASASRGPVLETANGALVIVGLGASLLARHGRRVKHRGITEVVGFSSGLMTVTAGVGGPALSIYALLTGWDHHKFVATIQPYFITVSVISVISTSIADPAKWPQLGTGLWILVAASLIGGLLAGDWLTKYISPRAARTAMLFLAFTGGTITLIKGVMNLGS